MKKALTHLSLGAANAGKIACLNAVAVAYQLQVQVYVDTLIAHDEHDGRALNQLVREIPPGTAVALERLSVRDMRLKSRAGNHQLRASQLGYIGERLRYKLDAAGLRYRSVQAAYSSQQCSRCGFTIAYNRRGQERFSCCYCGFSLNADHNAALVLAERFGDATLNACGYRDVLSLLAERFIRRQGDGRSPSRLPDTEIKRVADSHSGHSAGSLILLMGCFKSRTPAGTILSCAGRSPCGQSSGAELSAFPP